MSTTAPLYNYSPSISLMLFAGLIAALPLAWLFFKHPNANPQQRLRKLLLITAFLTFDLIVFGAFTRLTDSGLGCPDWPGCYGQSTPLQAKLQISAEQIAAPKGPVTHTKAWIEMIHRYWASGVGALIVLIAFLAWRLPKNLKLNFEWEAMPQAHLGLSVFTVFWVCMQGAFGAWTVTMKLQPSIVTLHLLGGVMLLCLLVIHAVKMSIAAQDSIVLRDGLRTLMGVCFMLVLMQAALGAWVSSNYAVLACQGFPQCNGAWLPEMDLRQGFELWRPLGQTSSGTLLSFPALVAIHWTHRLMAVMVVIALVGLFWRMRKMRILRKAAYGLLGLLLLQVFTGISNVVLGWPLFAALLHTAGAAAMLALLAGLIEATRADDYTVSASRLSSSRLDASRTDALDFDDAPTKPQMQVTTKI